MKFIFKLLLCSAISAAALSLMATCGDDKGCPIKSICTECKDEKGEVFGKTFFAYRPVNSNTARKMVGVEDKIHKFGKDELYGELNLSLEYMQTFKKEKLAKYFYFGGEPGSYGPECDKFGTFGYNFGTVATGDICLNPIIKNFIADFDIFLGWDQFICGLWTRLDIPINHTKWDLRFSDNGNEKGNFPAGLFDATNTPIEAPYSNRKEAFVGDLGWGKVNPLNAGRVNGSRTDTTIPGIAFDLGYDFISKERGHLAASIHVVAPTGTRPNTDYLFNAVSGANHSWLLGITLNAAYRLWENCDGEKNLNLYFDSEITHIFKSNQKRLFNLKNNGGGSAYLLLKQWQEGSDIPIAIERAANILHTDIKVGATIMIDASLMLQYTCGCFFGAIGYNFWLRSKETAKDVKIAFEENAYSIYAPATGELFVNSTSYSNATIGNCGTVDDEIVYLKKKDIDVCSALTPESRSNKIFANLGYNWKDYDWTPFVTLFGEVEFAHENKAASQWGIGLKGGISF